MNWRGIQTNGDLLIYSRGKKGEWQLAWHQKLGQFRARGLFMQADHVIANFHRRTSLLPAAVILHNGTDRIPDLLHELGVAMSPTEIVSAGT